MEDTHKIQATAPEPPRRLSNRDRDTFLALLEGDHEPNEALKAAAAEYNKGWYVGDVYHFQLQAFDPEADVEPHGTGDGI